MIIKYQQIPSKIKTTSNDIIRMCLEICKETLDNEPNLDLENIKVGVRNIKTSSGSSYHSTIIISLVDSEDGNTTQDKFDLLEIENNKNYLRAKLTKSWKRVLELHKTLSGTRESK